MVDSVRNRSEVCNDCGTDLRTEPYSPGQCAPCDESGVRYRLRMICGLCRGNGELREKNHLRDGRIIEILRRCHGCGGEGEQIWPR